MIGPGTSVDDIKGLDAKSHSWTHLGNFKARVDIDRYSRVHFMLQYEVQLTDTPIFAIFDEMSVNSLISVKFKNFEKCFFFALESPKTYGIYGE